MEQFLARAKRRGRFGTDLLRSRSKQFHRTCHFGFVHGAKRMGLFSKRSQIVQQSGQLERVRNQLSESFVQMCPVSVNQV